MTKEELAKFCKDNDIDNTPMTDKELTACVMMAGKELTLQTKALLSLSHRIDALENKSADLDAELKALKN